MPKGICLLFCSAVLRIYPVAPVFLEDRHTERPQIYEGKGIRPVHLSVVHRSIGFSERIVRTLIRHPMVMIQFEKDSCGDLGDALSREWLETNGLGGFASSTIVGANTRRYHSLLTVARNPPVDRVALLSKLEETVIVGDERFEISTNEYEGAIHPRGFTMLESFRLDPFPVFTYVCGTAQIEKSVFMVHDANTTVIEYRLLQSSPKSSVEVEVRPLIAFRDHHSTTYENSALDPAVRREAGMASVAPYASLPRLHFGHNALQVDDAGYWYKNILYRVERERGLDDKEDLFSPFVMKFVLGNRNNAVIIASTEPQKAALAGKFREQEIKRRKGVVAGALVDDDFVRSLTVAADQFLVRRGDGFTVIAGYPWFTDWGRDTMISLPGLTLFNGRADVAKGILRTFAKHVDQGMLPNRFPDAGEAPEFNTVDATLWFFEAVRAYAAATKDYGFVSETLYPVLSDIVDWHVRGTRYHIRMMDDGLLNAGEPGVQLTWMDAKVGDWVVTPRMGMPVEIQALWFNALKIIEEFAIRFGRADDQNRFDSISKLVHGSFNRQFWNEQAQCLYDVVDDAPDASIRPNQIFAVSLSHSMLSPERARAIVDAVERELLTAYGLRTLNRDDPSYHGRYQGDPLTRDSAYHQGTVWPWLIGPFITAYMKVHGSGAEVRARVMQMLKPMRAHLWEAGLDQISEVFDGDPPQRAGGCFAQAWSVAEVLRALCEDVYGVRRKQAEADRSAKSRKRKS